MLELLYPANPAPLIPAPTAESRGDYKAGVEYFPVVEPSGIVVGMASRAYCHGGAKPLHPVVHLHILDRSGNLYLQKRSSGKDIQPGKWDTAVGGHVDYGESFIEALYREAAEELGLYEFNPVRLMTYEFESDIERELVNVFAAVGNFRIVPDRDEVEDGRFWSMDELDENLGKSVFTPNFENEFKLIRHSLFALL